MFTKRAKPLPSANQALPGRPDSVLSDTKHAVFNHSLKSETPAGFQEAIFGMGCFWGAERKFWEREGVWLTAAGYAGGITPNPTYEEVCSGLTGHTEVVRIVFDPDRVTYEELLALFWESHNPTQGMAQGNDVGTQYRSAIYTTSPEQAASAARSRQSYQQALENAGHSGRITTEIAPLQDFYYAEDYHQQYLAKNPNGYCGLGGTGVSCAG